MPPCQFLFIVVMSLFSFMLLGAVFGFYQDMAERAELLRRVAEAAPETRIRFTSPHPKDFPDAVLGAVAAHANVCRQLHLPAQSGSSTALERMRRGYTREARRRRAALYRCAAVNCARGAPQAYLALAERARALLPGVALSSDFISGFCGETEAEHAETVSLIDAVRYEHARARRAQQRSVWSLRGG